LDTTCVLERVLLKRKIYAANFAALVWSGLLIALVGSAGPVLHAQEGHIKVLNGRNGMPITNECLNVWIGPSFRENLIAPTNNEGVVVLRYRSGDVTADAVTAHTCDGMAVLGPKPLPKGKDAIAISGDYYVPCREYGKSDPGKLDLGLGIMPSYSIKMIFESGISAGNTCGKVRAEAKPGELILFMRPMTFWEKMRL
jgi:hypothetical protein